MKDIVDREYIIKHQKEILELGDIVPKYIMKFIPLNQIERYFNIHKNEGKFHENFKTANDWINSEKLVLKRDNPEKIIELLKEWVDCYPQFKGVLKEENFIEYIENDGVLDHSEELNKIEENFHQLIMYKVGILIKEFDVKLPHITIDLLEKTDCRNRESFPVPGMFGGFYYNLDIVNGEFLLDVESWSRMAEGSGQIHEITVDEWKLVSEGFI